MRLHCKLRDHRGDRSLADIEAATGEAGVRVSGGILSAIERGRTLPTDAQLPVLERVYGLELRYWYENEYILIAFQPDEEPAS